MWESPGLRTAQPHGECRPRSLSAQGHACHLGQVCVRKNWYVCVCLYMCVRMCVHEQACICAMMHVDVTMCTCTFLCHVCVCMLVRMCEPVHISVCTRLCVHVCLSLCVLMSVYECTHIGVFVYSSGNPEGRGDSR